jgi:L-methionine (R)-S-oxide reductase
VSAVDPVAIVRALRAAHLHDEPPARLLALACERVHDWGPPFTSVYAYLLDEAGLTLAAYTGRATEHTRIPVGTGVCGTAVATGRDQNVPDVTRAATYLACSAETRSELVVLIRRGATILGQLDVDSDVPAAFDESHHAALRQVADALAILL